MGYDITYHPLSEAEPSLWYFDSLVHLKAGGPVTPLKQRVSQWCSDEIYAERFLEIIVSGASLTPDSSFATTHGFHLALLQGLVRPYFYTRGSAFSFLLEQNSQFASYTKEWDKLIPPLYHLGLESAPLPQMGAGVYIPLERIPALLHDMRRHAEVRRAVKHLFSNGRLRIFQRALTFCLEHNLGLLEASGVVLPHPFAVNRGIFHSGYRYLDQEGLRLFMRRSARTLRNPFHF